MFQPPDLSLEALFSLAGRVALVTGGSRGIGRAIAELLAAAGATVIVASRKLDARERAAEEMARCADPHRSAPTI